MARASLTQMLRPRGGRPMRLGAVDLSGDTRDLVYLPGCTHERTQDLTIEAPLFDVLQRIQAFVRTDLRRWQKRDEQVSVAVVYAYEHAQSFPLLAKSFRAHSNRAFTACPRRT